ncbi:protein sorting system archaetidylserine synthase [Natronomonas sp. F2-12]|jgi:CDP-diacylglycerol--serine O-phosphatidyltransferase|uniref:Protein sorting system archaetidylserine synthase n=1 Tax=Natronomonas aquatica TaxID=2841590 RepID=A0A9R1D734_9EURY|nr:protein sorting system archaetidylserine synthase [Natronomonas aquatica]MCQ4333982.1 protein sorting system archaetidylserine synthase [Natronomonas aquatica]
MQPRLLGRLGLADLVTVANAALGFVAVAVAVVDPGLAARLVLLAAIGDGLDGIIARIRGGTAVGPHLDSLADVASFGVAPAVLVYVVASGGTPIPTPTFASPLSVAAVAVPAVYVAVAVVRLGFYTLHDSDGPKTEGVQTTLAATILAAAYLAGITDPVVLVGTTALFGYLMVAPVTYPDLYARDATILGGLQFLAVLFPTVASRTLPRALLLFAVAYLVLAPFVYWREA